MDANSSDSNKRQRRDDHANVENNNGVKIDLLPEDIVGEIISFLPLKDAMKTSILSKPWKDRWKSITKIELKEEDFETRPQFREFVEKLLAVSKSSLRKFTIESDVGGNILQVNQWLSGFIKRTIQELNIHFERVNEQLVFPDNMFTLQSLTHFHLNMPYFINLPSSINFPSLRKFILEHVIFYDASRTEQLFAGCPSLQDLTLTDCIWVNMSRVDIVCPMLQSLVIRDWADDDYDDEEKNAKPCEIVIHASNNLKKFIYDGDLLNNYFFSSTTFVTDGTVDANAPPNQTVQPGDFVSSFLMALLNVEKLSISDFVIEALCHYSDCIPILPIFNSLVTLHLGSSASVNLSCDVVQTILRHSPNLETLEFSKGVALLKDSVDRIDPVPECFQTRLKSIRIFGFVGTDEEMIAIKFLMQSAMVCEEFYVSVGTYDFFIPDDDDEAEEERIDQLWEQMLSFPRANEIPGLYLE